MKLLFADVKTFFVVGVGKNSVKFAEFIGKKGIRYNDRAWNYASNIFQDCDLIPDSLWAGEITLEGEDIFKFDELIKDEDLLAVITVSINPVDKTTSTFRLIGSNDYISNELDNFLKQYNYKVIKWSNGNGDTWEIETKTPEGDELMFLAKQNNIKLIKI